MNIELPESECPHCRSRDVLIEGLRERVSVLEQQVEKLSEQVRQNSRNSSKPPSSDGPRSRGGRSLKRRKRKKGRKGRKGSARELLPQDEVTRFVECVPTTCGCCKALLEGRDEAPHRHQVMELPERLVDVTEYRQHSLTCAHCGESTRGELPEGVTRSAFGPRLVAFMATLTGVFRLSKRKTRELLGLLGAPVSTGSVSHQEAVVADALEVPYEEVQASIPEAGLVQMDETHWKQGDQKHWMWVARAEEATLFTIRSTRGKAVPLQILGEDFDGYLVTDRYNAYHWVDEAQRQFCWAHLGRDFLRVSQRNGLPGELGEKMLWCYALLFHMKHLMDDGDITRKTFERHVIRTIRPELHKLLEQAMDCQHNNTESFARELYRRRRCLFTFLKDPAIPLTNNAAERAVRHPVIWRKTSFGTHSHRGSRFVERILTAWHTLGRTPRKLLDFVSRAVSHARNRKPPPSLLLPASVSN